MKVKYEDRLNRKMLAIKTNTLVVGVDIAKNYHLHNRNVIMNFRVSPEEKERIEERIALSGCRGQMVLHKVHLQL